MRRYVRAVRLVLSLFSGYASFIIVRLAPWMYLMDTLRGVGEPPVQFYSRVIVSVMITCVIVATLLTWMLPTDDSSTVVPRALAS